MKTLAIVLALIGMCCLGGSRGYAAPAGGYIAVSKSISYARKQGWFKKVCPDCVGTGGCSTWYGGWEPCERCGGSGKVTRTWLFVVLGVVAVLVVAVKISERHRKRMTDKMIAND